MQESNNLKANISLALASILIAFFISLNYKVYNSSSKIIEIPRGATTSTITELLYKNSLILSPNLFKIYSRLTFSDENFKAGEYQFTSFESISSIIKKLNNGKFFYRKLTLLPGFTLKDILELGDSEGLQNDLRDKPLNSKRNDELFLGEGSFYPDTYFYLRGDSFSSILLESQKKWNLLGQKLWNERDKGLPYKSLNEAVTMASIIEKEGLEKEKIAGVFLNRLRVDMRLQSDPTVIYALGKNFDGNLKKEDLRIESPFNTYRYVGLPPAPISIVSKESLVAALKPLQTEYLYFVSMGNGYHKFSKTLSEHNKAVLKYQINAR
mgnify:CR=1 FL=1